ncbi:MAG: hypothetical protein QM770_15085 [Tepidisphaeraceae bacterium]
MHPIESIERRTLLSVSATLADGVLTVQGTSGDDVIHLYGDSVQKKSVKKIVRNDLCVATGDGVVQRFAIAAVHAVVVDAGAGDDRVDLFDLNFASKLVKQPNGSIDRRAVFINATLSGGAGSDTIIGSNLDDRIDGGDGGDVLDGGRGNDYITGGAGNDLLIGGHHNDSLFGEAGDDVIDVGLTREAFAAFGKHASGADYVSGGEGNDRVFSVRGNTTVRGVEQRWTGGVASRGVAFALEKKPDDDLTIEAIA